MVQDDDAVGVDVLAAEFDDGRGLGRRRDVGWDALAQRLGVEVSQSMPTKGGSQD